MARIIFFTVSGFFWTKSLERDDFVILAGVHVKEAVQHRLQLIMVRAARLSISKCSALEVVRTVDVLARDDRPLRLQRLTDDVSDLGAAQRGLRATRRDRRTVQITGENGGDLCFRIQFDETRIEALSFEEAFFQRDIGRQVEAVAANHLADGDLGLLRVGAYWNA